LYLGNPGSLLWLTEDRPNPELENGCDGFDSYKYGIGDNICGYALGDANELGRDGLVSRYFSRKVHYAWGLVRLTLYLCQLIFGSNNQCFLEQEDNGNGDTRCQAEVSEAHIHDFCFTLLILLTKQTQGNTHLERGQNFDAMLQKLGMPEAQSIDYVPGVSHDCEGMMYSDAGIEKV
jgi:hypothetical protein